MRLQIKFHSDSEHCFKNERETVRAFLYEDYRIEPHNHDFYEMNIVLRGRGTHQIENACFEVSVGDVFVIPPMTVHAYYNTRNLDVYHILLHKDFINGNRDEANAMPGFLHLIEIEPFLRQHFSSSMFLHLSGGELLDLKSDLRLIEERGEFDNERFIPFRHHTMWKILYKLSYLLYRQINSVKKKSLNQYDCAIVNVLEYINHNYSKKITIEKLYKKAFLSRSTFLRNFKEVCSCTPIEYINRLRCEKARELMREGTLSKTEIAHSCGFYDLSHMERMLKK